MIAMTVAAGTREASYQNVGTKRANDADHVAKRNVVALPFFQSLFRVLGEAKIRHAREALIDTIITVGTEKFQSAKYAERIQQAAPHLILSPFAAGQRHQQCVRAPAARLEGEHAAVFVIRVCRGVHQARSRSESLDGKA